MNQGADTATGTRSHSIQRNRIFRALVFLFILSLSLRMIYAYRAFSSGACFVPDSGSYLVPAENLLQGDGLVDRLKRPEITRPPVYPVFLAVMLRLLGNDKRSVLLAQGALLSLIPLVGFFMAWLLLGYRIAFVSSLLLALSPWSIAWGARFCSDGPALLFLASILAGVVLLAVSPNRPVRVGLIALLVGLLTAAYVLTRPLWPVIPCVLVAVFLVQVNRTWVRRLIVVLIVGISALTPVSLWVIRNARVANVATLSDIGVKTVYWYWAQRVRALEMGQDRFELKDKAMREDDAWQEDPETAAREYVKHGVGVLKSDPTLAAVAFSLNIAEQLLHPDSDVVLGGLGLSVRYGMLALGSLWVLLLILSGAGMWVVLWSGNLLDGGRKYALLGIALILSVVVLSSGVSFGGGSRLRLPVGFLVFMFAAAALTSFFADATCPGKDADSKTSRSREGIKP